MLLCTSINNLLLGLFNLRFGKNFLKEHVQVFIDQSLLHLPGTGEWILSDYVGALPVGSIGQQHIPLHLTRSQM